MSMPTVEDADKYGDPLFLIVLTNGEWFRSYIHEADVNSVWVMGDDDQVIVVNWDTISSIRREPVVL